MDIHLTYVNQSDDVDDTEVVVFARNPGGIGELPVAWLVIQQCGRGDSHPFVYSDSSAVGAVDSFGNQTALLPSEPGQAFAMTRAPSGDVLAATGSSAQWPSIGVANHLPTGTIDAYLYKDAQPCLAKTGLAPGETAVFSPPTQLWFLAASQVQQGQIMNSALVEQSNPFEVELAGVASADIVLTGGGAGPDAKPFVFTLTNVVKA